MERRKIKEKNIRKVVFETKDASSEYTKFTKDSEVYHVRYYYTSDFLNGKNYCSCCGELFTRELNVCPYCNGLTDDILNYKDIAEQIYNSVENNVKTTIYLWNGEIITI